MDKTKALQTIITEMDSDFDLNDILYGFDIEELIEAAASNKLLALISQESNLYEYSDSRVSVYTGDLMEFATHNMDYIRQSEDENGYMSVINTISRAASIKYGEELESTIKELQKRCAAILTN